MGNLNPFTLVSALLALQFVIFGWRINREVSVGDEGRKTWLLVSDFFNFASMGSLIYFCIVTPLITGTFTALSKTILGAGYVLIFGSLFMIAGHYRLFSPKGRSIYDDQDRDYPQVTDQEWIAITLTCFATIGAGYFIYHTSL